MLTLGKKGSGKSALLRKIVWQAYQLGQARPRIFFHDPQVQLAAPRRSVFASADAYRAVPPEARPPLAVFRGIESVEEIGALALEVRSCTLVLDEIDRAFSGKAWIAPSVRKIVHEGRHYRCHLLGGCRRVADIGEDLLGQADLVAVFKHGRKAIHDLSRIEKSFGPSYRAFAESASFGQYALFDDESD